MEWWSGSRNSIISLTSFAGIAGAVCPCIGERMCAVKNMCLSIVLHIGSERHDTDADSANGVADAAVCACMDCTERRRVCCQAVCIVIVSVDRAITQRLRVCHSSLIASMCVCCGAVPCCFASCVAKRQLSDDTVDVVRLVCMCVVCLVATCTCGGDSCYVVCAAVSVSCLLYRRPLLLARPLACPLVHSLATLAGAVCSGGRCCCGCGCVMLMLCCCDCGCGRVCADVKCVTTSSARNDGDDGRLLRGVRCNVARLYRAASGR